MKDRLASFVGAAVAAYAAHKLGTLGVNASLQHDLVSLILIIGGWVLPAGVASKLTDGGNAQLSSAVGAGVALGVQQLVYHLHLDGGTQDAVVMLLTALTSLIVPRFHGANTPRAGVRSARAA